MSISSLQRQLLDFAVRRDWQQFHTPKNLAMALGGEAGELLEIFQWLTAEEAAEIMSCPGPSGRVRDELADIFAYLLRLADVLDVDLEEALADKIERNEGRYPVERVLGRATKYTELGERDHRATLAQLDDGSE